jgi:flagellar motor switch protein FliN/FliY
MTEDKKLDVAANAASASQAPGDMPLPDDLLGGETPGADNAEFNKVVNENDASEEDAEAAMLSMLENLPQEDRSASADDINFSSAAVAKAGFQQLSQPAGSAEPRNIDLLMDVNLPISIELGRTRMSISEILALGPGSVVELNKLAGEPVDLLVNQKIVAKGEVVVVDENFGLRITQLVTPEERLKSLSNE